MPDASVSSRMLSELRASTSTSTSHGKAALQALRPCNTASRARRRQHLSCSSALEDPEAVPKYIDSEKERSRRYRRTVFTHDDWVVHRYENKLLALFHGDGQASLAALNRATFRSTARYGRHIQGLLGSRIVRGLSVPIGGVVSIATFVTVYEILRENGLLPPYCVRLSVDSSEPFNLTSFALSLLLVFRTNASYSRWLEARQIWAGIVNRSRDIVRQGLTWMSPDKKALREMLERWVIAFAVPLKCHLTCDSDLKDELHGVLQPKELAALEGKQHCPNYAARVISEIISAAKLTDSEVFLMDTNLTFLMDAIGSCEHIFNTPIPLSWTRHTSRFLVIWLAVLPFLLFSTCRWATVPVSAIISLLLLGIEEIGVQIEEPFSILPLDSICSKIAANVREMQSQNQECEVLIQQQIPLAANSAPLDGLPAGNVPEKLTSDLKASSLDFS